LFTAMISMILRSCSNVTGDIADFNSMTALTSLFVDSSGITNFTDGALPDWDACEIDIANLGISSTEVSNFFIRLNTASSSSSETVDAGGTTPAPSATGRAAILSLVSKGRTVVASDLEETGTVTLANMKQSLVDGTAFIDIGADISTDYAGADTGDHDYFIEVMDSAGKIASGWIGAIGGGETLAAAQSITAITKANPGVVSCVGHTFLVGDLSYFSGLTEMTELNGKYMTVTVKDSADAFSINDTSGYGSAESTDSDAVQEVTDCHANGVHIISTVDGSAQNWTDIEAGFDYNDASGYTYAIYAS